MSKKVKIYQTYNQDAGLADCLFHITKKDRDRALLDVDNVNHDSSTEFEVVLSAQGIIDFILEAGLL